MQALWHGSRLGARVFCRPIATVSTSVRRDAVAMAGDATRSASRRIAAPASVGRCPHGPDGSTRRAARRGSGEPPHHSRRRRDPRSARRAGRGWHDTSREARTTAPGDDRDGPRGGCCRETGNRRSAHFPRSRSVRRPRRRPGARQKSVAAGSTCSDRPARINRRADRCRRFRRPRPGPLRPKGHARSRSAASPGCRPRGHDPPSRGSARPTKPARTGVAPPGSFGTERRLGRADGAGPRASGDQ